MDEQPDARRLSFDSRHETPAQPSPPIKRPRRQYPGVHSESEEDEDFQPPQPAQINATTLKHSREAAAARRQPPPPLPPPPVAPPHDPRTALLDRIHGPSSPESRPIVRKGLGIAWNRDEEDFLIEQIGLYGPAWADIASDHCDKGGRLDGRDQVKLKDKARNLKEKMLRLFGSSIAGLMSRDGQKLPKNFEWVTPLGSLRRQRRG
jgi:hypothetical protein